MAVQQEMSNVGENEGGQPSRNSDQTGPETKEHRIDIVHEISRKVKNWFEHSVKKAEERTQSQTQWPRIPKVPDMMRGATVSKKFYEPRVISLGPYHHGKPHLNPVEMIKPLCAQKFLADSNQDIGALYTKIESNIEAVRKCYNRRPTNKYDDEALARMMLLDGCFVLHFIRSRFDSTVDMSKVLRGHQMSFVVVDLFLLENQLPFGVLKLIFEGAKLNDGSTMEEMIKVFTILAIGSPEGPTSKIQLEGDEEPSHLLALLRSALIGKHEKIRGSQPEKQDSWPSFRNIKELKAAGIYLKPSGTSFLTDISFNSYFFYAYLKLPPITIDNSTKPKFLNILAYEMCPDAPDDYAVTSYICFLYELIDHADDVKELRSKQILYNGLGSDEEVAKIFNEIANNLVDPDAYKDVKARIQNHYDKRWNTWIAQALHDYCSSPWTFFAFIAAVLILLFAGVSAYYVLPGTSSYWGADLLRSFR